ALKGYEIESKIEKGYLRLSGIRTGQLCPSDCLRVHAEGDDVVCECRTDQIRVKDTPVEDVLDSLLSYFEMIQEWEVALAAAGSDDSLKNIINIASEILSSPVIIADVENMMCAISDKYDDNSIADLRYAKLNGRLPWKSLEFIDKDMVFASKMLAAKGSPFVSNIPNIDGDVIACEIKSASEGFKAMLFVILGVKKATPGSLQLVESISKCIEHWIKENKGKQRMFSKADLLTRLASGEDVSDEEIAEQQEFLGMVDGRKFVLVKIVHSPKKSIAWAASVFHDNIPGSRCFEMEDGLFALCSSDSDLEERLEHLAARYGMRFGLSWRFSDWKILPEAVNQTEVVLSYTADPVAVLNSHCVLFYVFSILMSSTRNIEIVHPAIETLEQYDNEHNSDYLRTLWFYLRHERNLVKTAEDLNIHRNSLVYRVKRISEIIPDVDLDDPETREHLMMSFRLHGLRDRNDDVL
ncbi:MAG: PucR family transcriptional regulator, partial [Coriobacteriales bacterium]